MSDNMKTITIAVLAGMTALGGGLEAKDVEIRGVSITQGYPKGEVFLHEEGSKSSGQPIKVQRYLNRDTSAVDVDSAKLVFTTDSKAKSKEDATQQLGSVVLPAGFSRGIALFMPAQGDEPATVHMVDDSAKAFPAGSFHVLNLTEGAVKLVLQDKEFECPAGGTALIQDPPVGERQASAMRMFHAGKDGEWVQVASGNWPHPGKKRVLQIVTATPGTSQIQMRGLSDIAEVK